MKIAKQRLLSINDLLKINIEEAEFPLLEKLIETGALSKIKALLIQFHDYAENAIPRRKSIQDVLIYGDRTESQSLFNSRRCYFL